MHVRKLDKNDLDVFFDLRLYALLHSPTAFFPIVDEEKSSKHHYEKMLADPALQNSIFGAFWQEALIGFVGIHQKTLAKLMHRCHIAGLYIKPDHRNKGIATVLMQHVMHYGKHTLHCSIINLSVTADNLHAKKLYESLGFKTWGIERDAMKIDGLFYNQEHMVCII